MAGDGYTGVLSRHIDGTGCCSGYVDGRGCCVSENIGVGYGSCVWACDYSDCGGVECVYWMTCVCVGFAAWHGYGSDDWGGGLSLSSEGRVLETDWLRVWRGRQCPYIQQTYLNSPAFGQP